MGLACGVPRVANPSAPGEGGSGADPRPQAARRRRRFTRGTDGRDPRVSRAGVRSATADEATRVPPVGRSGRCAARET